MLFALLGWIQMTALLWKMAHPWGGENLGPRGAAQRTVPTWVPELLPKLQTKFHCVQPFNIWVRLPPWLHLSQITHGSTYLQEWDHAYPVMRSPLCVSSRHLAGVMWLPTDTLRNGQLLAQVREVVTDWTTKPNSSWITVQPHTLLWAWLSALSLSTSVVMTHWI